MTTEVSLNGGLSVDVSSNWLSPIQRPDGSWSTTNDYASGVTLGAGWQLTIRYTETLAHRIPEVFNPAGGGTAGQPTLNLPGSSVFTCTVTAQA